MKGREGGGLRDQETEKQLECHPIISSFHSILSQGERENRREKKKTALLLPQDSKLTVLMKDWERYRNGGIRVVNNVLP